MEMKKIFLLTDYKGFFGSKYTAKPYRSGYDRALLTTYFERIGLNAQFIAYSDVFKQEMWDKQLVLYTSSEEVGFHYKEFIEDIVLELEKRGAIVIPGFDYLRAHNNKVYMELLLQRRLKPLISTNETKVYGSMEELNQDISVGAFRYPVVIKRATGAQSKGVFLAKDENELVKYAKMISRTKHVVSEFKEYIRVRKHQGYLPESKYQHKFIVQSFIPNLTNDWKILVYGDHYYILNRGIKKNDFRASGSHYNYKVGSESEFPIQRLNEVRAIYETLDVPHLSLDYAFDGVKGYVIEAQTVYFGTSILEMSNEYYTFKGDDWQVQSQYLDEEGEYVYAMAHYLKQHPELLRG